MRLDEMMNEVIELYNKKYTWYIEYKYLTTMDGDKVPYCFVLFGDQVNNVCTPLYIDKQGKDIGLHMEAQTETDYECAVFFYETNIYDCVKSIYDEIIKRNKIKEKKLDEFLSLELTVESPCITCGTQRPCDPDECKAYNNWVKLCKNC